MASVKKFKIINTLYQLVPILIRDSESTQGSRQVMLMPKGQQFSEIILEETQLSPDIEIKKTRKIIKVEQIVL